MAHYAFLSSDFIVVEVITGISESKTIDGLDPETWYSNFRGLRCLRTSYNGKMRKNYAGVGYIYDPIRDAFIAPKANCHSEETFSEETCRWSCLNAEHLE